MIPSPFLINGEWRESTAVRNVVDPYTGKPVAAFFEARQEDILDAVRHSTASFPHTRRMQPFERTRILAGIADQIAARRDEFAHLITATTGKPIAFSRGEVDRSVFTFRIASEEAGRLEGHVLPLNLAEGSRDRFGLVRRFPIGPIAAITPFNFPLNLVGHKLAPAIAVGNPVVLKPSSNAPHVALKLAAIALEAGLPEGCLHVVPCSGSSTGQLIENEEIKLLSFTGSAVVGWGLKSRAGKKKVVLELGGNAGVIVDRSANTEACAPRIALGAYGNAGQSCISVQRILVHHELFDSFLEKFIDISRRTKTGDPFDEQTVVGPMIDEAAARKVEEWIGDAVTQGARVQCGGERTGAMLSPTVLTNISPGMKVCGEEVFAPVVTMEPFADLDEAVRKVNDSPYGLQAGIFSNDFHGVFRAFENLEVGGVVVNDYPTYRIDHMPYGGVKASGFGREGVRYAMEEMTEMKLMAVNPA
jgi:glyceraldehyde-3-phosphate dehydrogenase (NADP+)